MKNTLKLAAIAALLSTATYAADEFDWGALVTPLVTTKSPAYVDPDEFDWSAIDIEPAKKVDPTTYFVKDGSQDDDMIAHLGAKVRKAEESFGHTQRDEMVAHLGGHVILASDKTARLAGLTPAEKLAGLTDDEVIAGDPTLQLVKKTALDAKTAEATAANDQLKIVQEAFEISGGLAALRKKMATALGKQLSDMVTDETPEATVQGIVRSLFAEGGDAAARDLLANAATSTMFYHTGTAEGGDLVVNGLNKLRGIIDKLETFVEAGLIIRAE